MKKRKIKFFSLIMSLILVLVSVPIAVSSEEISSADISEEITEIQGDLSVTEQMSDIALQQPIEQMATTSTVSWSTSNALPDGIYSFSRNGNVNLFLKTLNDSAEADAQFVLASYTIAPHIIYTDYANFKVTRVPNTDRYIIRLMSNTNLTFGLSGTNIVTKTISANDSEVSINDTFYINYYNGGYTIQNCVSEYYVCWSGASNSYVVSGSLSNNAVWRPRGYRSYIEDGVYSFENVGNAGLWMDTQSDSYYERKHAQQYAYESCPIENMSRGGMFKIKQVGDDT